MSRIVKIIALIAISTLLGGCWDKIEIEDRAYISAVGIDLYKDENEVSKSNAGSDNAKESSRNRYVVTYVFPNVRAIGKNAASEDPRFVISSVGPNSFETTRMITARINKVITFKQLDTFLMGEEVARNADYLKENLDAIDRHSQINRKINFAIVEGTAKEVIDIESPFEAVTGQLIAQVEEKKSNVARFNQLTAGDILESLHATGTALAPRVVPAEKEIKLAGAAVIKGYRLIGWLGELENRAVMFLRGQVMSEIETVSVRGIDIPFIITESNTKKNVTIENEDIKFNYSIEMEGYIEKYELDADKDVLDPGVIASIESAVEKSLESQIMMTVEKLQKEFDADVIGIGEYLSKFKPELWKNIQNNWDQVFPKVDISVSIDAKLRRVGMAR